MTSEPVKLVVPTDFQILEAMSDGKRQTAPNLAEIIDRKTNYMNNRLPKLAGVGMVNKVGPADNSKMYVISEKGKLALEHRDRYDHNTAQEFQRFLEEQLDAGDN